MANKILQNDADADDVVQEGILKAARYCHQLRDEDKLFQWMYTIVKRDAIRHKNRYSVRVLLNSFKTAVGILESPMDMENYIMRKEDSELILKEIDRLSEEDGRIICMKLLECKSYQQIAKELGLKYNTVKSKYNRGLDTIRLALKEDRHEEE